MPARDLLWYGTGPHQGQGGEFLAEVSHSLRPGGGPSLYHETGMVLDQGLLANLRGNPVVAGADSVPLGGPVFCATALHGAHVERGLGVLRRVLMR